MEFSKVCISDADTLVKLCNAGYVRILGLLFEKVYIEDGQAIFEKINSMVRYPITVSFVQLMKRAEERFCE